MSPTPIKPRKHSELVADHIEEKIRSGEYLPGSKLPTVVELSEGYQVGRSTIREALSALKAKGLLEIRHGGGTYVSKELPGEEGDPFRIAKSLNEVLEVRKMLELGCASLAAQRRDEDDLRKLRATLVEMTDSLHDEQRSEEADVRFHLQIAEATHNELLIGLMQSLTSRLHESIGEFRQLWFYSERATAESLLQEHRGIVAAIEAGDDIVAAERMTRHLTKVEMTLEKRI